MYSDNSDRAFRIIQIIHSKYSNYNYSEYSDCPFGIFGLLCHIGRFEGGSALRDSMRSNVGVSDTRPGKW